MAKKAGDKKTPTTVSEAWEEEERCVDELVGLVKALRVCVTAVGASRGRAKFRASESAAKMREAIAEQLRDESRAFTDWAQLADQPALFSEDELAGRSTGPAH